MLQMQELHVFLLVAASCAGWALYRRRRSKYPFPPGPRPDPIIGNLRQMPTEYQWVTWAEWAKQYGPLTYCSVFGQHILIINTHEAAVELLEKRGQLYSDRPYSVMLRELVGKCYLIFVIDRYGLHLYVIDFECDIGMLPYAPRLRKYRKLLNTALNPTVVRKSYSETQIQETRKLLLRFLQSPDASWDDLHLSVYIYQLQPVLTYRI
jgi:hypothetical protein